MQRWELALLLIGCALAIGTGVLVAARRRAKDDPAEPIAAQGEAEEPLPAPAPRALAQPQLTADAREQLIAQQKEYAEAMRKVHALALGAAIAPSAPAQASPHEEVENCIRSTLAGIADQPNYAPRRPLLLPKLMQAMHDDEVSRRELARIIGTDPAMTGGLLRLANSPFYRISPEPVESLDRAIALLGIEGMRSLIAATLLQPVFRISGVFLKFGEVTWEHTLYSANAAEAHAAVLENSDPFAAQLLSLLMGLATIVLFRVATDEYLSRRLPPDTALLAALIDSDSPPVARQIAASWQLSERIDAALADQTVTPGAQSTSLGRSLQVGRFLGALAVLHARRAVNDDEVKVALQTGGTAAAAYERIWNRLRTVGA